MFDFSKNKIVESLDAVPEQYRGVYVEETEGENAGNFVISPAASGIIADLTGAQSTIETLRNQKKDANDESASRRVALSEYNDLMEGLGLEEDKRTVDGLRSHIDSMAAAAGNASELKNSLESVRKEMKDAHKAEVDAIIAKAEQKEGKLTGALNRALIGDAARQALAEAKGSAELLMPHIQSVARIEESPETGEYGVRVIGADGETRFNGSGQPMSVSDLVGEMKTNESFARAFESESPSGSGAPAGAGRRSSAPARSDGSEKTANQKITAGLDSGRRKFGAGAA